MGLFQEAPLTVDDCLYIARQYRPAGASPVSKPRPCGHPAEVFTPGGVHAIQLVDRYEYSSRDGEEVVRLKGRGRKSEPRFHSTDDFYPVREYALHNLLKCFRKDQVPAVLQREEMDDLTEEIFGVIENARIHSRRIAVPLLFRHICGITIEDRALKKYRAYLRLACWPYRDNPKTYLEDAARLFLARFPRT
jgi:hypothetical protein